MKKLFVALLVLLSILAISCDGNTATPDAPAVNTTGTEFINKYLNEGNSAMAAIGEILYMPDSAMAEEGLIPGSYENGTIIVENSREVTYKGFKRTAEGNKAIKAGTEITIWGDSRNFTAKLDDDVFSVTSSLSLDEGLTYKINGVEVN